MTTAGRILLGPIPTLPDRWWDDDDATSVWPSWDRNTYYLWGANDGNWDRTDRGVVIGGGGLAGPNGPTRGRGHPHYLGVNTMSIDAPLSRRIFDGLRDLVVLGRDVLVPTYRDRWSLGTGIAVAGMQPEEYPRWAAIQLEIFERLDELARIASDVVAPSATHWPDCRTTASGDEKVLPLVALSDVAAIIAVLGAAP